MVFPGYVLPDDSREDSRMREVDEALARAYAQRVRAIRRRECRRPPTGRLALSNPLRRTSPGLDWIIRSSCNGPRSCSLSSETGASGSSGWLSCSWLRGRSKG